VIERLPIEDEEDSQYTGCEDMGKTLRHHGRDGSYEHKLHRGYRHGEKDYLISGLQGDLERVRDHGKAELRFYGLKTTNRMNHPQAKGLGNRNGGLVAINYTKRVYCKQE
tara:strand:+ start:1260 stop:1589 length:330 start_codon:yes stop_codon:yes gene_type:complete